MDEELAGKSGKGTTWSRVGGGSVNLKLSLVGLEMGPNPVDQLISILVVEVPMLVRIDKQSLFFNAAE